MNKPEGRYCESCVGDNAATDYAATDYAATERRAGETATWRDPSASEPYKLHDAWVDPTYCDNREQERWHQGWWPFGRPN